jgi:formylglycine-generating enzyme required for sulfatase activity
MNAICRFSILALFAGIAGCDFLSTEKSVDLSVYPKEMTNSIGMEFVLIPAGEFMMGCSEGDDLCFDRESPRRRVIITKPFYLGKYEVTVEQWWAIMEPDKTEYKGNRHPIANVSYQHYNSDGSKEEFNTIEGFINKLNAKEGGNKYRLPTSAEWEYACRAGTTTRYWFGHESGWDVPNGNPGILGEYAWVYGNASDKAHPVGEKKPNPWGLYDMYGNVSEMVSDWVILGDELPYARLRLKDPIRGSREDAIQSFRKYSDIKPEDIPKSLRKTIRGGSWRKPIRRRDSHVPVYVLNIPGEMYLDNNRASYYGFWDVTDGKPYVGFRLAVTIGN